MTTATPSPSAELRAKLDHPIIDGDSHIIEFTPAFMDYLRDVGGGDAVEKFAERSGPNWYQMSWDERRRSRPMVPPWWALPTESTLDRATAMLPKLYYGRLDEVGLDFVVLYPTMNLDTPDPECDLDYIPNEARECRVNTILSNAFGMGGTNAIVIFRRWTDQ